LLPLCRPGSLLPRGRTPRWFSGQTSLPSRGTPAPSRLRLPSSAPLPEGLPGSVAAHRLRMSARTCQTSAIPREGFSLCQRAVLFCQETIRAGQSGHPAPGSTAPGPAEQPQSHDESPRSARRTRRYEARTDSPTGKADPCSGFRAASVPFRDPQSAFERLPSGRISRCWLLASCCLPLRRSPLVSFAVTVPAASRLQTPACRLASSVRIRVDPCPMSLPLVSFGVTVPAVSSLQSPACRSYFRRGTIIGVPRRRCVRPVPY